MWYTIVARLLSAGSAVIDALLESSGAERCCGNRSSDLRHKRKICEVVPMEDIKLVIAENISSLRRVHGMTQAELAERINYSDKAVSKWERGESVPDISVLKEIADIFNVSVDYLITSDHTEEAVKPAVNDRRRLINRVSVTSISVILVWLVATLSFVVVDIVAPSLGAHWLAFVYAVPTSMIVWLVFNSIWFNRRRNFLIISLLMWTSLAALTMTLMPLTIDIWKILVLGVPGQAIILLWSRLRRAPKAKRPDGEV